MASVFSHALAQMAPPEEKPPIAWLPGPAVATLGDDIAEIHVPAGFAFANAKDAKKLLESMGNPTDGSELGLVVPQSEDANWFAIFEYRPVGYVSDDDHESIDATALLNSISVATEAANEQRKAQGSSAIHVRDWILKPNYDPTTHNLQWAMLAQDDDGSKIANYNVRLLGREGYMSVTLVDDPTRLAAARPQFDTLLGGFSYKAGRRYGEYVKGDRVAEIGLAALVAGGAGAAAAKLGLLGKLGKFLAASWKLIVLGFFAVVSFFRRIGRAIFGKREEPVAASGPPAE